MNTYEMYFDKEGNAISFEQWALLYRDWDYRRIGMSSDGDVIVSTVWLGLDHSISDDCLLIFETMIFGLPEGHPMEFYQERYSTERAAQQGHMDAVKQLVEYERLKARESRRDSA